MEEMIVMGICATRQERSQEENEQDPGEQQIVDPLMLRLGRGDAFRFRSSGPGFGTFLFILAAHSDLSDCSLIRFSRSATIRRIMIANIPSV